jgi:simple sugar transport system permease protein
VSDPVLSGPGSGDGPGTLTVANRLSGYIRGGGVLIPIVTALIAFFIGGIFIALAGANPIDTYRAIFEGSGLNWLLPWVTGEDRTLAALNLQQTLILTAPLILTGLAVAFAFRAGLFNIGGNGQYLIGSYGAVYAASSFEGMPGWLHIIVAMVAGAVVGALWGGIAGFLKAATGANEVISTIMLNYTALYMGLYFFGTSGPLHSSDPANASIPVSNDIFADTRLPVFWGDPELQGLHIGIFIAVGVTALFWVLLNRSTTGYEVRAVGFNPDAAEYGGISAGRNYVKVMLICGAFAGLAGAIDVLGWQYRIATIDVQVSLIGFTGIAVALLGRNTAVGTAIAALLFAALQNGTSVRNLDPAVFEPELATNLATVIQGLIVLFVSAPVLVTMFSPARLRRRRARRTRGAEASS